MKFVHSGVSLSLVCTLSNLGPLSGCLTASLGPIPPGGGLNQQLDIPLTIQDRWLPTARLPAFMIALAHFCLPEDHPNHFHYCLIDV